MLVIVSPGTKSIVACAAADMLNRTRFQPIRGVVVAPIMGVVIVPVLQPNTCFPLMLATISTRGDVVVHWPPSR